MFSHISPLSAVPIHAFWIDRAFGPKRLGIGVVTEEPVGRKVLSYMLDDATQIFRPGGNPDPTPFPFDPQVQSKSHVLILGVVGDRDWPWPVALSYSSSKVGRLSLKFTSKFLGHTCLYRNWNSLAISPCERPINRTASVAIRFSHYLGSHFA
jgi:hypothetical protein